LHEIGHQLLLGQGLQVNQSNVAWRRLFCV